MTVEYALALKSRRMAVVLEALSGGSLELLAGETLLARVPLSGGLVLGPLLTFGTSDSVALAEGEPDAARLTGALGEAVVEGLTVGESLADVRIDRPLLRRGQTVRVLSVSLRHA